MITNSLLEEIYETQKRLDKEAKHDIKVYFRNAHHNVSEIAEKYGFILNYSKIKRNDMNDKTEKNTEF